MRKWKLYLLAIGLALLPLLMRPGPAGAQTPLDTSEAESPPEEAEALPGQGRAVSLARATWDTGWFQTELFKHLLEELGYTVQGPKTWENPAFYQAAAGGETDLWANGWFPLHNTFIEDEAVQGKVEPVGFEVKAGALQGYLIDKETAESLNINSLADLRDPEIARRFDADGNGRADLIGCNVGWGCERLIEHHLDAYDLRDTVDHIQGDYSPLMGETVSRYRRGEPVLFYTWTPNWTIGALEPGRDVIWLEVPFASLPAEQQAMEEQAAVANLEGCPNDPCLLGFPPNDIRAVANVEFLERNPAVRSLMESVVIPLEDISTQNARLIAGEDEPADIQRHAQEWIDQHQGLVETWLAQARQAHAAEGGGSAQTEAIRLPIEPEAVPLTIDKRLRVATKEVEPFVIYENRQYSGFSIELWDAIAQELGVEYDLYAVNSVAKLLDEAQRGAADVATAGIGITSQREQNLDFSYSFFESGLQIMVPDHSSELFGGFLPNILRTIFSSEFLFVIGSLLVLLLISAHVIWYTERSRNPEFPEPYLEGLWEAFWWSAVTVTTVGYGDKTPRGPLGRLFALFWMFAGLFILAYFTAGVTSTVTLQGLQGAINGPEDLTSKRVGSITQSAAAEYLLRQGIAPIQFDNEDQAFAALEAGELDAVVYDAPVLQHYASHQGQGKVRMVGLVFEELSYGIALEQDSPYREAINLALLQLMEDGTYKEIHDKWFGQNSN